MATLWVLLLLAVACVSATVVEHRFEVQNLVVNRLCQEQVIVAVNGRYPGPTLHVHEGDTVIVHVFNKSPYDITIHWHGVTMLFSGWSDGASYVTQCPITPGSNYTYKFDITNQEGTLWWHAHFSWLRATVHGALIIHPKDDRPYPFQQPDEEIPILLGEWFNGSLVEMEYQYLHVEERAAVPYAYTVNGQPGDFFQCSSDDTYKLKVTPGKTYLLRIINVALSSKFFFNIANHKMTVVSADGSYTAPYVTDVVYIAPGQSIDVLLEADQPPGSYYLTAYARVSEYSLLSNNMTSSAILVYEGPNLSPSISPIMPNGPDIRDTMAAYNFSNGLKGLPNGPFWVPVPQQVDEHMFITVEMGIFPCDGQMGLCLGPYNGIIYGDMNNVSFQLPNEISMLEAFYKNIDGVYTEDFPNEPPVKFDYTNLENRNSSELLWIGERATKVKKFRYNTTVQIVLQNTVFIKPEGHPVHLHGFNFHVVAQGFGNFDPTRDEKKFNLINPQIRNTIDIPENGWAAIRFQANNPGVWLMHCHLEFHQSVGIATAFVVENGPSQSTSLPPPPFDLPKCNGGLNSASDHQFVRVPVEMDNVSNSF